MIFGETDITSKAWLTVEVVNQVLLADQMEVSAIYLIGSYAAGKANDWSDIDFLVQLKDLSGKGRIYPPPKTMWKQIQEIHKKLDTGRIHVVIGTLIAQDSLFKKRGNKFAYRQIQLYTLGKQHAQM